MTIGDEVSPLTNDTSIPVSTENSGSLHGGEFRDDFAADTSARPPQTVSVSVSNRSALSDPPTTSAHGLSSATSPISKSTVACDVVQPDPSGAAPDGQASLAEQWSRSLQDAQGKVHPAAEEFELVSLADGGVANAENEQPPPPSMAGGLTAAPLQSTTTLQCETTDATGAPVDPGDDHHDGHALARCPLVNMDLAQMILPSPSMATR